MKRRAALTGTAFVAAGAAIAAGVYITADHGAGSEPLALNTPPTGLHWATFQGMQVPQANEGPHNLDAVAPTGYDHSPTGAALAAINATIRLSVANGNQWSDISRRNIAPGPGRDWFAVNRVQVTLDRPVNPGDAEQVIGYRVRTYTESGANVDIVTAAPDSSKLVTFTQVAWTHNQDWGLVLPDQESRDNRKVAITETPPDTVLLPRPDTKGAP